MVDQDTTQEMWEVLSDLVEVQKAGDPVTAEEVLDELQEFLAMEEIELPATFQGNVAFELFEMFVEGGAVFVTNSYPDDGNERHTHPIFIECGKSLPEKITSSYPGLQEAFMERFCPGTAVAVEVETKSGTGVDETALEAKPEKPFTQADADAELYQYVDLEADGGATALAWMLVERAVMGNEFQIGDGRNWRVTRIYEGFVLNGEQMKRVPPPGYVPDVLH